MVRFKGRWVTLDPKQVQAALRFFEQEAGEGELGLLDALRLTADDAEASIEGLEVEAVDVDRWLDDLLARAELEHPRLLRLWQGRILLRQAGVCAWDGLLQGA